MPDSASSLLAILVGLGVFALIVGLGWRSVQNRRILRFQDAGKETIVVAGEDDEISSFDATTAVTATETSRPGPAPGPSDLT